VVKTLDCLVLKLLQLSSSRGERSKGGDRISQASRDARVGKGKITNHHGNVDGLFQDKVPEGQGRGEQLLDDSPALLSPAMMPTAATLAILSPNCLPWRVLCMSFAVAT